MLELGSDDVRGAGNGLKGGFNLLRVHATGVREDRTSSVTLKQPHAQELLQLLDMVADSGWCDPKLLAGLREASVLRGGAEGKQGLEWRQPVTGGIV